MISATSLLRPASFARQAALVSRRYASGGPTYNAPTGYLFGERPVKGQKRKWESWEAITYFGFFGGIVLAAVIQIYRPDTSIQTWALEEAKRRMEARGELPKYVPSSQK